MSLQAETTALMTAPSSLVGEGSAGARHTISLVRDRAQYPLTRPRRARAPSPTRGQGKIALLRWW